MRKVNVQVNFLASPSGCTIFVDNNITSGSCTNYNESSRNCTNGIDKAYNTLQGAANIVVPGDVVCVRGGIYSNGICTGAGKCNILYINISGTNNQRITFENYNEELVRLMGYGFEDRDLINNTDGTPNPDGYADGTQIFSNREEIIVVKADYIDLRGFEIENSSYNGGVIRGSYNLIENLKTYNNWMAGLGIGVQTTETKIVEGNVIRYVEAYNNRHGSGIVLGRGFGGSIDIDLPVNQVTKKREGIDRDSLKKVTQLVGSSVLTLILLEVI